MCGPKILHNAAPRVVHNVRCSYEHSSAACCTNLIFSKTWRDRNFFRPGWEAQMQGVDYWVGVVASARQHRPLQTVFGLASLRGRGRGQIRTNSTSAW